MFAVMAALILTATVSVWRVRAQIIDQPSASAADADAMSKEWMYPGVRNYTHTANHVGGPIVEEYATNDAVEKVWRYYQEKIFPAYNRFPWPTADYGELVQVATLTTKGIVGPANYSVPCARVNTCTVVIHRPADTVTVMVSRYPERKEVPFDTRILVIIDKH
jgi:hypothetical protein